jgi:hypothetical protein
MRYRASSETNRPTFRVLQQKIGLIGSLKKAGLDIFIGVLGIWLGNLDIIVVLEVVFFTPRLVGDSWRE